MCSIAEGVPVIFRGGLKRERKISSLRSSCCSPLFFVLSPPPRSIEETCIKKEKRVGKSHRKNSMRNGSV